MENTTEKKKKAAIWLIFTHSDAVDVWFMILGFIGSVGEGLSMPLLTFVGARLMNNAGAVSSAAESGIFIQKINQESLNLVYLAVGVWIASFLEGYCWTRTGERQATRMRTSYLKAVLRQDISYFDMQTTSTAEIITSVSNDSLVIQNVISEKIPDFLSKIVMFIVSYIFAIVMEWRLALIACPFALLLIIPGLMCGRTLMNLARRIRAEYGKAGAIAEQAVSSIRTVYSFAGEKRTMSEFSAALEGSVKLGLRQGLAKGLAIGSSGVIFAMWAFIAYYGSRMVMYHGAQGGTIYAVGALIAIGGLSLGASLSNLKPFSEACSIGEHVMEVIDSIPNIDSDNMEGEVVGNFLGEVEFRHVDFAYPSRQESLILKDFCLVISSGKTVALVGGSGSGKSTVIALLQRFYDPLGGEILLDGIDIGKLQLKWLRSQIGLVSQEPTLFATTIKENILFGKEDAPMEEIVAAAKASNAHNFISQLPQGYDTQVGERGIQMSGGQKQRIAIARALIRAPKILLLDEATSALDSESERAVQDALDKAAVGRTTVIVAHRLSTIRQANVIAVIQNGHVIETGSHDELMENDQGAYFSLVSLQQTKKQKCPEKQALITDVQFTSSPQVSSVRISSVAASSVSGDQKVLVPSFRRLLAMNSPEWKQAVIGCLSAIIFGAVQPIYALAMGSLLSVYFSKDHNEIKSKTKIYSLVFLGLSLVSVMSNVILHYNFGYMGEYLTRRIRERILSKILTFEIGWFDQVQNSSGAICSRLAKDASIVRSLVGDRMSLLVQTVSGVTIACVMGVFIAWKLALAMIAIQPLVIATYYTRNVLLKSMSEKATRAQEQSSKLAAEAICNIRTISAYSSQNRILKWLEIAQEGPKRENIRQSWFAGIGLGISQCLAPCILAFDFWYGGKLIYQGEISSEALFETFLILVTTGRVIADAGSMTSDLAKGSEAVGSLFAILDRKTKIDPDPEDSTIAIPDLITGEVEICDVDFAYPSRSNVIVLKDFSITIKSGKSTALVGPSGSGKSTIIGLIERFYDPLKGTVKIDGIDIKAYNLRSLRKQIALVSQEPALFSGTIRENIAYGASDQVTESEIIAAAKSANAHDFISGLSNGYNTACGDRGGQLSGGQKQRIAIARAILKNPALLLLDEATSALDGQSEKVVQAALEAVMVGRTSVVIAHRLSTVQGCDLIAVVEKGEVIEKGSHHSLLAKGPTGAYFSLVSFQGGQIT